MSVKRLIPCCLCLARSDGYLLAQKNASDWLELCAYLHDVCAVISQGGDYASMCFYAWQGNGLPNRGITSKTVPLPLPSPFKFGVTEVPSVIKSVLK